MANSRKALGLARHIVEKMAAALGDRGLLKLMDFYKCYRACVRGKVASMRSEEAEIPEVTRKAGAESARRHFRLALQYALCGSRPMTLVVMGRIASGKSALARALADELDWKVFSSDRTRKELADVPLYERGNTAARAKLYPATMTRKTYADLAGNAVRSLKAGNSVILDATFARRIYRSRLLKSLGKVDADVCFIELQISGLAARRRLKKREHSTDEISDARWEDFQMLNHNYEAPRELPAQRLLKIRAGKDLESTLTATLKGLARLHGNRVS